ncbi:ferric reductase-like transmembrane domain-containing protein [Amycolatopsis acidiphila]|uniref:Iron reductase n=1 Tax=Amycolatopsis acidiphila TaxID=715473 RepID=A0A558A3F1_9PSEU|nr:ferric reductase-like transmembrane domain-containing protein [Amycolatopsis acidiphila]TVT18821.1 iron reductase [Amycolatopsis acidiphila]UIJ61738.1 ferric reductase-like transmembrane domain-containing protein [Amycolatopsis acidiphila]GHG58126.1 ferric reductase [Amycolatopsis acidiphila]
MTTTALWDFGRGSGVVALVLLTASLVLGIATRSGRPAPWLPRFAVTELHRNLSLLAATFLALHVGLLLFDPYAMLRLFDLVLPFAGDYRPFWQGLGTVALDVLLALVVTSLLRHRLGRRTWRAVHWAGYALWPVALVHALGTGTDSFTPWFLTLAAICTAAVAGALCWRLSARFAERHNPARLEARP